MRSRPTGIRPTAIAAATAALAAAVLTGTALAPSAAAAGGYPTCNTFKNVGGHKVPAYGQPTPSLTCNLVLNDTHSNVAVEVLQQSLNACYPFDLDDDGYYGPKTFLAVKSVQDGAGISDDGLYGPDTRDAMKHWGLSGCGKI
ncbi:peptidoglycan-binding protein [Streptomyces sp. NPDC088387]|uniref:peptidoglycan-binding domain-containing protein n=1 Tax=Streptomyces sp. NPDC088387 TaxID=3365859 RepID=UPI003813D334